jgi:hypothetical protein
MQKENRQRERERACGTKSYRWIVRRRDGGKVRREAGIDPSITSCQRRRQRSPTCKR